MTKDPGAEGMQMMTNLVVAGAVPGCGQESDATDIVRSVISQQVAHDGVDLTDFGDTSRPRHHPQSQESLLLSQ